VSFSAAQWKAKTEKEKQDMLMKYRLAYEGKALVNWCPELGTVLANDEIVDDKDGNPVSERGGFPVVKKEMRQWFMRITAYADRLLTGLDGLNWSEHVKEIERNWIGKSEGAEITFKVVFENTSQPGYIPVFTTRVDTLFGAAFLALAPEHLWVTLATDDNHKGVLKNVDDVKKYLAEVKNKSVEDRMSAEKEKTGVELKGVKAVNPANGEEIPVYVADFVMVGYGTGAVFGDAHDERDVQFAKKHHILVKDTVIPRLIDHTNPHVPGKKVVYRKCIMAIIKNTKTNQVLTLKWKKQPWTTFVMGGIEEGETLEQAATREIREETGYKNFKFIRQLGAPVQTEFFAAHKDINRIAETYPVYFELTDEEKNELSNEESAIHELEWVDYSKIDAKKLTHVEASLVLARLNGIEMPFTGEGVLIDSGKFTGMKSEEARPKIVEFVGGKMVAKYKMRDAVFARQRYWGEPIPLMTDKDGIIHEVPEKNLPLKLPEVKSYKPTGTGESPLASVPAWVKKGYETNTMPGWAGSSWYFLRYMDPRNKKAFVDKKAIHYWKNVDMYVGGAEHATGHILYARFWHKFLKDYGLVMTDEPFQTWKSQGYILGTDGRKMSKRWGNVINPDEVVKNFGADTLRVYEMFMGPFEGTLPWSTDNLVGSRRFVERVWKLAGKVSGKETLTPAFQTVLHKTIQKVGSDIESFAFNTAVSAMMILVNEMEKMPEIGQTDFEMFLKILSPFAPHVAEEIWHELGQKTLIVQEKWPVADAKKMKESQVRVVIQVNSRVRAEVLIVPDASETDVVEMAKKLPAVDKWLEGKEIKKIIYISGRLLNIVTS
jgi:leucyl-tRNA synthetase